MPAPLAVDHPTITQTATVVMGLLLCYGGSNEKSGTGLEKPNHNAARAFRFSARVYAVRKPSPNSKGGIHGR